jgi:sulfite reductase (ferredoxin)
MMHDVGAVATVKDGKRGFEFYVGGGLGSVPNQAKLFDAFLPEEELLPMCQAMSRVFARLGEKKNRNTARLKFLVNKLGLEEFRKLVLEERKALPDDPAWTAYLKNLKVTDEKPLKPAKALNGQPKPEGFEEWRRTNVYAQRQAGYAVATVTLPLGDFTARQARRWPTSPASTSASRCGLTVEQNLLFRWVSEATCRRSTASSRTWAWASRARDRSSTSRPARAPTPASSASRRRAAWRASSARGSRRGWWRWTRRCAA